MPLKAGDLHWENKPYEQWPAQSNDLVFRPKFADHSQKNAHESGMTSKLLGTTTMDSMALKKVHPSPAASHRLKRFYRTRDGSHRHGPGGRRAELSCDQSATIECRARASVPKWRRNVVLVQDSFLP